MIAMKGANRPIVSIVLATHNRCAVVRDTVARVHRAGLERSDYEIILVDNASTDGTRDALSDTVDQIIALADNRGSCAKVYGTDVARGLYIVFLDDDSAPRPGSLHRMIAHFERDPALGAAGFTVHLPHGDREGAALPHVFVGCGVGLRLDALRAVGGLDESFFMQAEEYDLSFRLAADGWTVRTCHDLHVDHLKTTTARRNERTVYYDIRNNLRVAARYLPVDAWRVYRRDYVQRYGWLASTSPSRRAFRRGRWVGLVQSIGERRRFRSKRLRPPAFERFFCWRQIESGMKALKTSGVHRLVFADLGKNVYPFVRAARMCDIRVSSIADDRFAHPGRRYHGIPIEPIETALLREVDGIVVANTGPVHAARTAASIGFRTAVPVHDWFGSSCEVRSMAREFDRPVPNADVESTRRDVVPCGGAVGQGQP